MPYSADRRGETALTNRRAVLVGLSGALLAPAAEARIAAGRGLIVGLQLYTVGKALSADFDGALRAVSAIGYRHVELAGWYNRTPEQMRMALSATGLTCVSAHETAQDLKRDLLGRIGRVRDVGARWLVCPMPPVSDQLDAVTAGAAGQAGPRDVASAFAAMTLDDWKRAADFLNHTGEAARAAGLNFGYHNHNIEFRPLSQPPRLQPAGAASPPAPEPDGWSVLWSRTDPHLVKFELDLGWIAASGRDPRAFLQAHAARIGLLHLKDLKPTPANTVMSIHSAEVGAGIQDWPGILRIARAADIRMGFVEQEPPDTPNPLQSAKASFDYLARLQERLRG